MTPLVSHIYILFICIYTYILHPRVAVICTISQGDTNVAEAAGRGAGAGAEGSAQVQGWGFTGAAGA